MPIVTCTKCPTQLRVPEGATGNVKCPKCKTIFPVNPKPAAAFEVVDDEPAKPAPVAKPAATAARPAAAAAVARPAPPPPPPPAPAKKSEPEEDFNFDDDYAPKKKRRDDDDEEDDRDRKKKRRRDDDDEDDRPRSKRRRDDDDDEDDRPRRKKKSRRDDDEDDEDDYRPPTKGGGYGNAKTGMLLLNISYWLYLSSLAIVTLLLLIVWVAFSSALSGRGSGGGGGGEWIITLVKLPGILGLGNWIVSIIGLAFCIAGPVRTRGIAITATVMASVHLILLGVFFSDSGGLGMMGRRGADIASWPLFATTLFVFDAVIPAIINGLPLGTILLPLACAIFELLQLVFTMVLVKGLARGVKDYDAEGKAHSGMVASFVIVGGSALACIAGYYIVGAAESINLAFLLVLVLALALTAITVMPLLATNSLKVSLARRARRG